MNKLGDRVFGDRVFGDKVFGDKVFGDKAAINMIKQCALSRDGSSLQRSTHESSRDAGTIRTTYRHPASGSCRMAWLAVLVVIPSLCCAASAQDPPLPPTPDDVPGLQPEVQPEVDQSWAEPDSYRGRHGYGVMSDWDLYAGSVYANSSPLWVHAEGLLWWMRGNELPVLATTRPGNVVDPASANVLFGDQRVDGRVRGGFRTTLGVRLGHWADHLMDSELEFGVLWVGDGQSSGDFYQNAPANTILARPFFDAQANAASEYVIAAPGVSAGELLVQTSSDFLSSEALFRRAWYNNEHARIDWLVGYRYARLRGELFMQDKVFADSGEYFETFDDFRTFNEFHGADLGFQLWTHSHGWTVEFLGKLALGAVNRTVEVDGQTYAVSAGGTEALYDGGVLAQPTNMGRYQSSQFSVLPELTVRLRRPISRFFTFTVGYTALLLNNVVRTGDQIDLAINPSQVGGGTLIGAARPAIPMNDSIVWVHGLTVGLEW